MNSYPVIPIAGESIYSILARSHILDANYSPLLTLKSRTGVRGYKPLSGLPTHLETLARSIYVPAGPLRLIQAHTHFPLYAHFLSQDRQELVKKAMLNEGSPKARLGLLRNDMGARDWRRYCIKCKETDIERNGVAIWHREHSLSGVMICPVHDMYLYENATFNKFGERELILPDLGVELALPGNQAAIDKLTFIAVQIKTMMECSARYLISGSVYRRLLQEKGLLTKQDRVRQRNLEKLVLQWLNPLKDVSGIDRLIRGLKVERSWVAELVEDKDGFHHPVKHIALWGALGVDFYDVINTASAPGIQMEFMFSAKKQVELTQELIMEVLSMTKSFRQAAYRLGVDLTVLQVAAESQGIDVPRRPKKISAEIRALIAKECASIPSSKLAEQYNVSIGTVYRIRSVSRKRSQISMI